MPCGIETEILNTMKLTVEMVMKMLMRMMVMLTMLAAAGGQARQTAVINGINKAIKVQIQENEIGSGMEADVVRLVVIVMHTGLAVNSMWAGPRLAVPFPGELMHAGLAANSVQAGLAAMVTVVVHSIT